MFLVILFVKNKHVLYIVNRHSIVYYTYRLYMVSQVVSSVCCYHNKIIQVFTAKKH